MAKKTVTITLAISELLYDVRNKAFLTGRSRQTGNNHEQVAHMQASDDDDDQNQILRSIGNAFGTLETKLSEYIEEKGTSANNVQIESTKNLTVTLQMPSNYNESTAQTIADDMHKYIVYTAVGDWFAITNKDDAKDYIEAASVAVDELREALNKRVRPVRTDPALS